MKKTKIPREKVRGKKATFKIKIMKGTVKKIKITGKKTVKAGKTLSLKASNRIQRSQQETEMD